MEIDGEGEAIVFFDLETTFQDRVLLEFGAIFVCPRRLIELDSYSTLIRPTDPSFSDTFSGHHGITRADLASAPLFPEVADDIYQILNARIWAGHNIKDFDCPLIKEEFAEIGWRAPRYRQLIDSYPLLTEWFGKRAGDMKLSTLAAYFRFEEQPHRCLPDVRMNLEVLKHCGTVLFLESIFPEVLQSSWISPNEVSIPSTFAIPASFYDGNPRIRIMHNDIDLKLHCSRLKVQLEIRKFDDANRRLTFVVAASRRLCEVLDECDILVEQRYKDCGGDSEWLPVVNRDYQSVRLRLKARVDGNTVHWRTQIERYQNESSTFQRVESSNFDSAELANLFIPGTSADAFFSLETFDYREKAGIGLVADKLIIHHQ
ncbi:protein NEN4 isoform X1 [Nicotiana tabacum]|uniref:Protein NEN1 isoform X1 n=1 Tax=Nicotiana tabacum TaxID=4097 RepID=A0A1S3XQN5_TOBAC|nr:PREDICTED: protein NEN1-like isoform X1 [Nicotiana tabacum]